MTPTIETNIYEIPRKVQVGLASRYDHQAEQRKRELALERAHKCWTALDTLRPAKAQALIIAELEEDQSDSQSDYFGSRTTRRVAIGWRTGKREDFRQLRRAAARYAPTAHLGPNCGDFRIKAVWRGPDSRQNGYYRTEGSYVPTWKLHGEWYDSRADAEKAISSNSECMLLDDGRVEYVIEGSEAGVEHRDNYSMGHGNWVGLHRHSGWQIRSLDLNYSGYRDSAYILWLPGLTSV
ncbi:MAG TPA: hypothetical protein VKQ11_00600 [Candidatus Sulfotelmatobacter sp.]|nr:hypothetical protein [Candidatus Sulfotelmatobacter sp.]